MFQKNFTQPSSSAAGRVRFTEFFIRLLLDLEDSNQFTDSNEAQNFVTLLSTVRKSLDRAGSSSHQFLLTAAVSAGSEHYKKLRLQEMTSHIDFFNLMAYNYAGGFSAVADHQANLEPFRDVPELTSFFISVMLDHYIHTGNVSPSKMILRMLLYGRAFINIKSSDSLFQSVDNTDSWKHEI
ncbi:hypothetical protein EMCG_05757 [[Emmonsia] crescens]|uniref:GH18 domain-containing protein n=1 Tax=[Emmonsia] crescens TaxID=73230 RepID=A0A0G2J7P3_9EURO|nr:hypothetical protein EMCG_05757 [Emmonsia crescens UAMH 3008]